MGMIVNVYRSADGMDCTMNGVSSRFTRLCVVNVEGPFEPSDDCPAVILEVGPYHSIHIKPLEVKDKWVMFGGNYAGCSDSRFIEAIEDLTGDSFYGAVAIHDRVE